MAMLEDCVLEKYAQGLFAGLKQRDAYFEADPRAKNWKSTTLDVRSSQALKDHPEIMERVQELRDEAEDALIMQYRERMVRLSNIARDEEVNVKFRISAIDTLNKMDGTYLKNSSPISIQGVTIINDTANAADAGQDK